MKFFLIALSLISWINSAQAKELIYSLSPVKVAQNVYAFIGSTDYFNRENGGNIVNTGFIIGTDGVIVIDSGPSLRYGLQMRKAIRTITPKPVTSVIITHHHPDHFLGNTAFPDSEIYALPETIEAIKVEGDGLLENMFHMVGDWMIDTELKLPTKAISSSKMVMSGRSLRFLPLNGHTQGDLAIMDEQTGVLFAGDLAFYNRTATTPHAHLHNWYDSLDILMNSGFKTVVPGHGPIDQDGASLEQTLRYLKWLEATLKQAAKDGLEMTEVLRLKTPEEFKSLDLHRDEFYRSVSHLWPDIVNETLPLIAQDLD
ncbi:Metallo-beta-lactamase family protein [Candidatus Terasakiella magnetica]|uniref:Metallo-beta-lactamase family protein n=1 Tax=Candidatus Terasakiella magnetica TaxID=1867952 RepID=A0A1C3RLC1_9PROT|nr:quinoprotein relay system zinc metallohydrolase 1 [Candidatus Terasakiella magnetica]SCA57989.1 Metallo-beta-lactamase family protein [Candidatus Terasakiella magnetica]